MNELSILLLMGTLHNELLNNFLFAKRLIDHEYHYLCMNGGTWVIYYLWLIIFIDNIESGIRFLVHFPRAPRTAIKGWNFILKNLPR